MAEYIEREPLKRALRVWITECMIDGDNEIADGFRDCIDLIDDCPAADVEEVVRCKDCQWYGHKRACPLAASGLSADCIKLPKEDDFCSYGERRKEKG